MDFAAIVFAAASAIVWTYFYLTNSFGWQALTRTLTVSIFYGAGLGLGAVLTIVFDKWFLRHLQHLNIRRLLWLIIALAFVMACTSTLLVIHYRLHFVQWVAQYAIFGIRYHGPGSIVIIAMTCWWATRTKH